MQKNTPALTWHQISCKFFACKLSSLGPGAELLPQATEIRPWAALGPAERVGLRSVLRVSFPHAPFLLSRFGFCSILFFLGGFHPGSLPFPPLSAVFWSPFGALLVESGLSCFRSVFLECFLMIFDACLIIQSASAHSAGPFDGFM